MIRSFQEQIDDNVRSIEANNEEKEIDSTNTNEEDDFTQCLIQILNDTRESDNDEPTEIEIACALLASFFSGRMTQHALSVMLRLFKILLKANLPSSFDELS